MKVEFGGTQLAGFGGDSVSGFTRQGRVNVDLQESIRAEFAVPRNRGNKVNEVSFQVWKEYASVQAAEIGISTLTDTLEQLSGAETRYLKFSPENSGTPFWLLDAVMYPAQMRQVGVALIVTYRFVGGDWTTTDPATT